MRVLSIDVDFFVDPIAHHRKFGGEERLPARDYKTDSKVVVEDFLDRCALTAETPVPAVFVRHHHEAFDVLRSLCSAGQVAALTNVDAHADLGLGDSGYAYLMTDLVHRPRAERSEPMRSGTGLNEANWIPFAVANGWLESVTFVPRRHPPNDLHPWYFAAGPDSIVVRKATLAEQKEISYVTENALAMIANLPSVASAAFRVVDPTTFKEAVRPDFVVICQSPQFTPKSADRVLAACLRRVTVDALQGAFDGPVDWSPTA